MKWVRQEVYKTFERSPDSYSTTRCHSGRTLNSSLCRKAASGSSVFSQCHFCVNWFHFALKIIVILLNCFLLTASSPSAHQSCPVQTARAIEAKLVLDCRWLKKALQTRSGLFKLASLKPSPPLLAHTGTL